jgi:predicted NACHT family NTPase
LELETVSVDLGVDPAVLGSIPQDPIRIAGDGDQKSPRDMFAWLQAEPPRNFAIVGPPGGGKTTLLKHLALGFAAGTAPLWASKLGPRLQRCSLCGLVTTDLGTC